LNQIVALQILFGSLIIGILLVLIILVGYPILWLIRRSRMQKSIVGSEEWLEGETKDVSIDTPQAKQMSITTHLKLVSRRRKLCAVILSTLLIIMSAWLSRELSSYGIRDSNVFNTDTRVFSEAYTEDDATRLLVIGSHDLTLAVLSKFCIC
jgi:hypothetical protein